MTRSFLAPAPIETTMVKVVKKPTPPSAPPPHPRGVGADSKRQSRKPTQQAPAKPRNLTKVPASSTEKRPSQIAADLADPHRKRGTYLLLERAIRVAMDVPYDAMILACQTAIQDLHSPDDRTRSRAREFLFKAQDSGIGAAIGLDRMMRLDDGTATENVAIASITPDALAAVVQTLRHSTQGLAG